MKIFNVEQIPSHVQTSPSVLHGFPDTIPPVCLWQTGASGLPEFHSTSPLKWLFDYYSAPARLFQDSRTES